MDKETITTSPSDSRLYMHTEEEMEDIIEGLILMEMGRELMKKGKHWRILLTPGMDVAFNNLLKKLAGEDAEKIADRIHARHEAAVKDMNPVD